MIFRVSFPFDNFSFSARKPLDPAYPVELETVGDHLRKRRLDLGLWQKQVAKRIGVTTCTITNWELSRTGPEIQYYPAIIDFLGYLPYGVGKTLPEKLKAYRMMHGLSQTQMAKKICVDDGTLRKWENGKSAPRRKQQLRIEKIVNRSFSKFDVHE